MSNSSYRCVINFSRPRMCSWWHQAGRSTWCLQHESWSLSLLFHLSCTTEEARLVSQCTSELKHTHTQVTTTSLPSEKNKIYLRMNSKCGNSALSIEAYCSGSPPGMIWPTSWTVRAEFLSSVFTLITPWLSPPMDNMALAGSGAPRTPGLRRKQKEKWTGLTGS